MKLSLRPLTVAMWQFLSQQLRVNIFHVNEDWGRLAPHEILLFPTSLADITCSLTVVYTLPLISRQMFEKKKKKTLCHWNIVLSSFVLNHNYPWFCVMGYGKNIYMGNMKSKLRRFTTLCALLFRCLMSLYWWKSGIYVVYFWGNI